MLRFKKDTTIDATKYNIIHLKIVFSTTRNEYSVLLNPAISRETNILNLSIKNWHNEYKRSDYLFVLSLLNRSP